MKWGFGLRVWGLGLGFVACARSLGSRSSHRDDIWTSETFSKLLP